MVKNGDIFDINQTVNGCNLFILIDDKVRYWNDNKPGWLYEYDQTELLNIEEIEIIDNINSRRSETIKKILNSK